MHSFRGPFCCSFTAAEFQRLTYNLCFVYQRCTRSISCVAPVYYARMIAVRSRLYLKQTFLSEGSVTSGSSYVSFCPCMAAVTHPRTLQPNDPSAEDFADLHDNLKNAMYFV